MTQGTTLLLYEMNGLAMIAPSATGVMYRSQTGGHACLQTAVQGYLVPIGGYNSTRNPDDLF